MFFTWCNIFLIVQLNNAQSKWYLLELVTSIGCSKGWELLGVSLHLETKKEVSRIFPGASMILQNVPTKLHRSVNPTDRPYKEGTAKQGDLGGTAADSLPNDEE